MVTLFDNLFRNSIHLLSEGGRLKIEVAKVVGLNSIAQSNCYVHPPIPGVFLKCLVGLTCLRLEKQQKKLLSNQQKKSAKFQKQEYVAIAISDTAGGIKAEPIEKIFEPGFTQSPGGTGLGLYLVSEAVALHRGRIGINPCGEFINGKKGCQFQIYLPLTSNNE